MRHFSKHLNSIVKKINPSATMSQFDHGTFGVGVGVFNIYNVCI